jgi:cytochrome c biogenesis protein CcmG, thiol:disulfide interchange protein DsbE
MKRGIIIALAIVGAFVFTAAFVRDSGPPSENVEKETENSTQGKLDKAPDFTLKDYNGIEVSLADFRGTPVIVNAWAAWCPFCKEELPDFAALQKEFEGQVVVIAIDRQESLETAKEFTDSYGISEDLIYLLDPRDSFYKSIGAFAMPETIFVDEEGNIREHIRGPINLEQMREKTEALLPT